MNNPGPFVTTISGRRFYPLDPREEDIDIQDIAHALAYQCRFNGHIDRFYSVAEHSVLCSFVGPEDEALERLLHDAPETWIGDLVSPVKCLPTLQAPFKAIEHNIEVVLARKFGLRFPFPPSVKAADQAVFATEIAVMRPRNAQTPPAGVKPADVQIHGWPPMQAKSLFLQRFAELMRNRGSQKSSQFARAI